MDRPALPQLAGPARPYLTVDVEDWFHPGLDPDGVRNDLPRRVDIATLDLLDLCDELGLRGTFFVLGDVARHHPGLAGEIARRGHGVGVHGLTHRFAAELGPNRFRSELRVARSLLEDQTGRAVLAHRAPYFSLLPGAEFAFDVLAEEGITLDSSIFPAHAPRYGQPRARLDPHQIRPGLWEYPVAVWHWHGLRLPFAGGAWFRLLPLPVLKAALDRLVAQGSHAVLYIHPWELDAGQQRISTGSRWTDLRQHHGRREARSRFAKLMRGRHTMALPAVPPESPIQPLQPSRSAA